MYMMCCLVFCSAISSVITYKVVRDNYETTVLMLAKNGIENSIEMFSLYNQTFDERDYWEGVSAFRQYVKLAIIKKDNSQYWKDVYREGQAVLSLLFNKPEEGKENIIDVLETFRFILDNMTGEDVPILLARLSNKLT